MNYIAVKGTHDVIKEEAEAFSYIENVFKSVCELYGYHEFRTPTLEYTEVFTRNTGDSSDVVRKEMYTFLDKGNRSVTMRPEFTAGMIRCMVEKKLYATDDLPLKACYCGPAFRYERPQLGRYRQFNQAGVECVGMDSARWDAECIALAIRILGMLGFEDVSLKINTLGDKESRDKYRSVLKEYFSSRIDEMCEDCKQRLELNPMRILDCKDEHDRAIIEGAPKNKDCLSEASDKRFYETLSILNDFDIPYEIDDRLVRGLDYYGEVVFEVHVKSKSGNDYGAVLGGGHYDGMFAEMGGPDLAGVGFAFGVERVYLLMKEEGLLDSIKPSLDIYVMPIGDQIVEEADLIAEMTRALGYTTETPHKSGKLGSMFKKAERRGAKVALLVGEDELKKDVVIFKNMHTQVQEEISLEHLQEELDKRFEIFDDDECDDPNCECHHHENKGA